jgi:hypothetical protein
LDRRKKELSVPQVCKLTHLIAELIQKQFFSFFFWQEIPNAKKNSENI